MDPDIYARAREHFFRLQDLAESDRSAALDALIADEPEVGRYVASLLEAEEPDAGDLFEDAVKQGMSEKVRDMAASLDLVEGQRINALTIVRRLDGGGFGDVYLAHQDGADRTVALKIIKAGMDTDRVLRRFESEKRMLAALEHPNIARLYDAGHTPQHLGSRPYFVMEYVDGPRITRYCDDQGLSVRDRIRVFIGACRAGQHAHSKLIIHRDLKPSNILVATENGAPVPKVIDFGIAKALDDRYAADTRHTLEGQVIGTLDYMSPEQADGGGDADVRTDVYALGVVLYELLTGTLPFDTHKLAELKTSDAYRIIREVEPKNPSTRVLQAEPPSSRVADGRLLKEDLDWITQKCLAKEPHRRYQTVGELVEDLENHLAGRPVEAIAPPATYKLRKYLKRNWLPVATVSAIAIGAGVALAVYVGLVVREASTRVERDEYQSKASQLEEANARLEASEARTREVNSKLQTRNAELAATQTELESKNAQLERQSLALQDAVDETTRLAEQERQAKEEAQRAREALVLANADLTHALDALDASLGETQEARERAEQALVQAEENARLAAAEAARADAEAANFKQLFDEAEASIKVITQGNRIPSDVLREVAGALDSEGLLQAQIYEHLAERSVADADWSEAIDLQEQALGAYLGSLGSDERATLLARLGLASFLQRAGRWSQADEQLDLLSTAAERSLDPDDELRTRIDLARGFGSFYRDDFDEALALLDRAAADLERRYGAFDPRTLGAVRRRAMVHAALGNASEAEADYRRVLTLNDATTDEGREDLAIAANNLAVLLRESDRDSEAEAVLGRAVRTARGVWGVSNWRTAMVEAQHASALVAIGRFERAEGKLLDAYDVLEATLGAQHRETRAIARELLSLYQTWDAAEGTTRHASKASRWQRVLTLR
ncbi:MAG: protein kinase [Phycisphaerales bacterium]|jgi:serine/threonine protein kinase